MNSTSFEALTNQVRTLLESNGLDYVMIIVNNQDGLPDEGVVGIHADKGVDIPADMLFEAAAIGESAPQHFIERILTNTFKTVNAAACRYLGKINLNDKINYS